MRKLFITLIVISFFLCPRTVSAAETHRFVTVVNPVRARHYWQSVNSVEKQINLINSYKLPATWLLQYDVLVDAEALPLFNKLPSYQEVGVFLEASERLATDADAAYLVGIGSDFRADKILLSGYPPEERMRMIDAVFGKFKEKFGYYPVSVGAWYIDSLSLAYMEKKYHIRAVLDCSDQYQTDGYGVWGKPWGTPYYPSKLNSLIPSADLSDKLDLVKIQWAGRDPVRGFGLTSSDSTYSVQTNDYTGHNLGIDYFQKLAKAYLYSPNPITQLTVGLEAGQEGAAFLNEYNLQLQYLIELKEKGDIVFRTMSSFATEFKQKTTSDSSGFIVYDTDISDSRKEAFWYSNSSYRIGLLQSGRDLFIRDLRVYQPAHIFGDSFSRDGENSLKRIIPPIIDDALLHNKRLLVSGIDTIKVSRNERNIELIIKDNNGKSHGLLFAQKKVISDGADLLTVSDQNNRIRGISGLLFDYWLNRNHIWQKNWRFSTINGITYLGIPLTPSKLIGIRSRPPFWGIFNIPFQVLVRFKTIPRVDFPSLISINLVKLSNNSTIRITGLSR